MRWSVTTTSVWRSKGALRFVDLRFSEAAMEAAYCRHRGAEPDPVGSGWWPTVLVLLQGISQVTAAVYIVFDGDTFQQEQSSHILYFSLQTIAAVAMVLLSVVCFFKFGGISWSSEFAWACVLALSAVAGAFQQRLPRSWLGIASSTICDAPIELEISVCLLSLFIAICCHVLPMRCCYLAPLVVLSSFSLLLQPFGASCGSLGALQPRALRMLLSLALLLSSYRAAHRCEKMDREHWLSTRERERHFRECLGHKELAKAVLDRDLKILRSHGCTMAFGLSQDFRICCGSIRTGEGFFQTDLMGQSVFNLMMYDTTAFTRLCVESRGSRMPRALQVTLLVGEELQPALLILLHHGRAGKEYLLGIKLHQPTGEGADDSPGSPALHPFAPHFSGDMRPQATLSSGESRSVEASPSDSLCYTLSLDMAHVDCGTEMGPAHLAPSSGRDKCVETAIVWSAQDQTGAFRCRNCSKPPRPAAETTRKEDVLSALAGAWDVQHQFREISQPFIKRLYIQPDGMCIDALGQQRRLEYDANGEVLLLKGRLWVSGDTLFREGRSGIVMRFDRAPEHPLFANDDEEEEEEEEEELAEEDQETDNLHILENMVSGVASHRSDLRNFLR